MSPLLKLFLPLAFLLSQMKLLAPLLFLATSLFSLFFPLTLHFELVKSSLSEPLLLFLLLLLPKPFLFVLFFLLSEPFLLLLPLLLESFLLLLLL